MTNSHIIFSKKLALWLSSSSKKTVGSMLDVFDEKSCAFVFLVLMIFPAAPIPTAGLVHVFEAIVILLALQLVIGRRELWLPKRLMAIELDRTTRKKVLPFLLKRVQFFERFSHPRAAHVLQKTWFRMQLGVIVIVFSLAAFFAPPFTNLDTLPSLGVVLIALGIILDDLVVIIAGYIVGAIGVSLAVVLGYSLVAAISSLF